MHNGYKVQWRPPQSPAHGRKRLYRQSGDVNRVNRLCACFNSKFSFHATEKRNRFKCFVSVSMRPSPFQAIVAAGLGSRRRS
jgi:hypothetical protein